MDSNGISLSTFDIGSLNLLYMNSTDPNSKQCAREIEIFLKNKNKLLILMSSEEWENCMENEEVKNKLNLPHIIGRKEFGYNHAVIAICFNEKCEVKLSHESNFYGQLLYKINLDDFFNEANKNLLQDSPRFINDISNNDSKSSYNETFNSKMNDSMPTNNSNITNPMDSQEKYQSISNTSHIKENKTNEIVKERTFEAKNLSESDPKNKTYQNLSSEIHPKNNSNNISSENHSLSQEKYYILFLIFFFH